MSALREVESAAPSAKQQYFPFFAVEKNDFRGCVEAPLKREVVFSKTKKLLRRKESK